MRIKFKTIILFIVGSFLGCVLTGTTGFWMFKHFKESKRPKRYDVRVSGFHWKVDQGWGVYVASSLDRVFQDGKTLLRPTLSDAAKISLARNEYESFQVVVTTAHQALAGVVLNISDLVNAATGNKIENKNIAWNVVGYVPTKEPYYPVKYVGLWPDPLLTAAPTNIAANTTQPFWVSVYAPVDAPAGVYQGTVTVSAQGMSPRTIPVEVHVYSFALARESHLKTAFDYYPQYTFTRYPQAENEPTNAYEARIAYITDKFIMAMLKYRMNPVLNIDPTKQEDLANIDRYRALGLNNFAIGKKGGTFNNNWPKSDSEIEFLLGTYRTYGETLKLNHVLPYTYIYTWDEGDMGNPVVAKICSMIHRAYKGLKNMVCYHGLWDPDTFPGWGKDIDIWCFHIDNFNEKAMRRLQALGMEMWMYISGPSGYGSPNLAMDFDSIDYRMIPWLSWKYDIRGFLYWCVNFWPNVNPFESAKNTDWEQNANGLLFYPGKNGPLASIRVEIFRDGMEDYEYIQILMENLKTIKGRQGEEKFKKYFEESIKLLTVDNTIATSMFEFTKDNQVLENRRKAIAQKIEEFKTLSMN